MLSVVPSLSHVQLFAPHSETAASRLPCPLLSPRVCSDSCPWRQWFHPTISSSGSHFSSCPQCFPASGSFLMSQLSASGGHRSFSASISPSNQYSGLISFRIDWFDLLAVGGTLESLLQHRNSKASILWCSAFFMVHFSHLHMTTGETTALTIQTCLQVMSLLFNRLFRFIIASLPRGKCLLISWLQSQSTVILEYKKIKSVTASTFSSSICHEWWNWMHDISFLNVEF